MNRIVVLSALFGNSISDSCSVLENLENGIEYIMITDQWPNEIEKNGWKLMRLPSNLQINVSRCENIYKSKYCKWMAHHIPDIRTRFDYMIWVDAHAYLKKQYWLKLLPCLLQEKTAYWTLPHPSRKCIYEELKAIVACKKDSQTHMMRVKQFLESQKFPRNEGLYHNGCFFRSLNNEKLNSVMDLLWLSMRQYTYRDQALLKYAMWKLHWYDVKLGSGSCSLAFSSNGCSNHFYVK